MAVAEALTNLAASDVRDLSEVKLSANWMVAAQDEKDNRDLYATVQAIGMELCVELGISIPVGKDSMSMQTRWQSESGENYQVTAPLSCVISAFAPVTDVSLTLTPELVRPLQDSEILFIDIANGRERMACSALAQTYVETGHEVPDVDNAQTLRSVFKLLQELLRDRCLLAYHDRSDGGLITTLLEMAFAARCGLEIDVPPDRKVLSYLFNEECGAAVQVATEDLEIVKSRFEAAGLAHLLIGVGRAREGNDITISQSGKIFYNGERSDLHRLWSATSFQMQSLRDNPECARQEYDRLLDLEDAGLFSNLTFDVNENISAPLVNTATPKIAIFREQGVNGQHEMAAAFMQAGFQASDVTMTDIESGDVDLSSFQALVACGGFSYGDVLGAGQGWAKSILFNTPVREQLQTFFERPSALALGVCNGCQMFSHLRELIPGTEHWPTFVRNESEQYEARVVEVHIPPSPSAILRDMEGSYMPVVVAHGEGRARFVNATPQETAVVMQYVDYQRRVTQCYPANPNGSPQGVAGVCNSDGRVTIFMPHPERIFRTVTNSWQDPTWGEYGPWMRIFRNARTWFN